MKTILFGKPKGNKFRGFEIEDETVSSIITPKKDIHFARFLFDLNLPEMAYLQDSKVSRLIFKSLGIASIEPASDNTLDLDNVIMSHNIEKVFEVAKGNELVDRYLNSFFKRHSDKFIARFGHAILIISDYDDMDDLPDHYKHNTIDGKNIYSVLNKEQTTNLYQKLINKSGEQSD